MPLREALRGHNRRPLLLLTAAAAILLVIACANVASLLLARTFARRREIAVRFALGARRRHLYAQLLREAWPLAVVGTGLGLAAAAWLDSLLPLLLPMIGGRGPVAGATGIAGSVAVDFFQHPELSAAMSVAITVILTAVPMAALRGAAAATTPSTTREGNHGFGAGSRGIGGIRGIRSGVVVIQAALSLVLLLSAGLLLRSFALLVSVDPGFQTDHVLRFGIGIPESRYSSDAMLTDFHRELAARLREIPGVDTAAVVARLPPSGTTVGGGTSVRVLDNGAPLEEPPRAQVNVVGADYFGTLDIVTVAGRAFDADDTLEVGRVALLDATACEMLFGEPVTACKNAVGQRIQIGWRSRSSPPSTAWTIVGVVEPIRQQSLEQRLAMNVALTFAVLALALTASGVFGVVAYLARQRQHEIAVRRALGAGSFGLARLVALHGARLATLGAVLGGALFVAVAPLLRSRLYAVRTLDPPTLLAGFAALWLAAVAASLLPSLRAVRQPPMPLLRRD